MESEDPGLHASELTFETLQIPNHGSGIDAITKLAREGNQLEFVNVPTEGLGAGLPASVPLAVDQATHKVYPIKDEIEKYRTGPARREGIANVTTLASFVDLVNRHKDSGSAVFADTKWPDPSLTAVLDYHDENNQPRHGKHRVKYAFPVTEELKAWIAFNGKAMAQIDFARFLEDHAAELAAPFDAEKSEYEPLFKERFAVPIDLIELSRHLEVFVNAKVKQASRLQTGERQVEFIEEHMNGKGEAVDIPGIFMISVQAFVDGDKVRIPARLRYRVHGGAIQWHYDLYRWEFWLRDAVQTALREAAKGTSLPAFEGKPEL